MKFALALLLLACFLAFTYFTARGIYFQYRVATSLKPPLAERRWEVRIWPLNAIWFPRELTDDGLAYRKRLVASMWGLFASIVLCGIVFAINKIV